MGLADGWLCVGVRTTRRMAECKCSSLISFNIYSYGQGLLHSCQSMLTNLDAQNLDDTVKTMTHLLTCGLTCMLPARHACSVAASTASMSLRATSAAAELCKQGEPVCSFLPSQRLHDIS